MNLIKQTFVDELATKEASETLKVRKIKKAAAIVKKQDDKRQREKYLVLNYLKRKLPNVVNRSTEVPQKEFDKLLQRAKIYYGLWFAGSISFTVFSVWQLIINVIEGPPLSNIGFLFLILMSVAFTGNILSYLAYFDPENHYENVYEGY